ncbi:MAG: S8 family serine peptidase [Anaerolineae bacterium]|nr:S8 family serine peptidase [Anaerolineae bacterium]
MQEETSKSNATIKSSRETEVARPHGCVTGLFVGVILLVAGSLGCVWLSMLMPGLVPESTVSNLSPVAVYSFVLLLLFGAVALFVKDERFGLWRGIALSLAMSGAFVLVIGGLYAADQSLTWPGMPDWVTALCGLLFGAVMIIIWRRHFIAPPLRGTILLGMGLGLIASLAWGVSGSLGTPDEVLLAFLDALSLSVVVAVLIRLIFIYDEDFLARWPIWSMLISGAVCAAFLPGLFAMRGYWVQGNALLVAVIPFGVIAGMLLTLGEEPQPRRTWWATIGFLFCGFLLPFAFTEGVEGDWMLDELLAAWSRPTLVGLLTGSALAVLGMPLRRWIGRDKNRLPVSVGVGIGGIALAAGAYLGLGQPGVQPFSYFVVMADQADTDFAADITDLDERRQVVFDTLIEHAEETQSDLRAYLDQRNVSYTPYYLVNGIEVQTYNPLLRYQIIGRSDVEKILDSPQARPLPPEAEAIDLLMDASREEESLSWGIDSVDAELVWEEYDVTGEGIVIGHADSGVDWHHPALESQYMGSEDSHDYTWFDPWEGTTEPTDAGGHGTHTLGTILGQDRIGVAPGAKWIACRNLARNLGNPPFYLDCMQFLFAPFPQGGDPFADGDPSHGANITSNSWGCPPEEGCDGLTLAIGVSHLRNAGQMFVVSAGNEGPVCSSVWAPASADDAFSVGAIGSGGDIAYFSSRGPVLVDGSGRVKPDIVAPGVNVLSSIPGGGYGYSDGTSMAGPHVAGVVALLWSADPVLIGDVDRTEEVLTGTAHYSSAGNLCGADTGEVNNVYGYGLIDADDAVQSALGK